MDVLTAASSAYTGLKIVKDVFSFILSSKIETETQSKIADAMEKLGEAQDALFHLRDELFQLQTENKQLKDSIDEQAAWKEKVGHYSLTETEGGAVVYESKEGTKHYVCPRCVESNKEFQILQDQRVMSGAFKCPGCKNMFGIKSPRPQQRRKVISPGIT